MKKIPLSIEANKLSFYYDKVPVFRELSIQIREGNRVLLVGANGVGKSTLLRVFAGHHLVPSSSLSIFGSAPFDHLVPQSMLVDQDFPLVLDLSVKEVLTSKEGQFKLSALDQELLELLEIDLNWRMNKVSEGMKRRVQLLLSLRRKPKLLLLDEITAHLDLVVRTHLFDWLKQKSLKENLTLVYATHILDGLVTAQHFWPTHLLLLGKTNPKTTSPTPVVFEAISKKHQKLLEYCKTWILKDSQ